MQSTYIPIWISFYLMTKQFITRKELYMHSFTHLLTLIQSADIPELTPEALIQTIRSTINDIMLTYMAVNDYETVSTLCAIQLQLNECENELYTHTSSVDASSENHPNTQSEIIATQQIEPDTQQEPNTVQAEETAPTTPPNRHTLYEPNIKTSPLRFELNGQMHELPKKRWNCFFEELCDLCYNEDSDKFNTFIHSVSEENLSYCTIRSETEITDDEKTQMHRVSDSDIFVSFSGSSDAVRKYAIRLLKIYEWVDGCTIEWRSHTA